MAQRIFTIAIVCFFLTTSSLTAAPLNPEFVPKDAKWILHVDYKAFTESAIAERIRTRRPQVVEMVRNWCLESCGVTPDKDISSVTLFSDSYKTHSGAAVFSGRYDEAKVQALLEKKRDVSKTEFDGHTYFTWKMPHGHGSFNPQQEMEHLGVESSTNPAASDHQASEQPSTERSSNKAQSSPNLPDTAGDREVTAVLLDGKQAVMAGSLEQAKDVVQLLAGNEPTLKADSPLIAEMPTDAIVYGAAIELSEIGHHERPFPVLEQHESIRWSLGQRDDEMFETLTLVANERRVAREMETALEGLIALGKLWAGDLEKLAELYDDTEITRTRRTVEVDWQGDVEDVMAALDELQPRFQAWREYKKQMR